MDENPLVRTARNALAHGGLAAKLISERFDPAHFGDAEVVLAIHDLVLRLTRDRGQYFLDLASAQAPTRFFPLSDIEVAFGWRPAGHEADAANESLEQQLARLQSRFSELTAAFSPSSFADTLKAVDSAKRARTQR
jgi:hypothetical protein